MTKELQALEDIALWGYQNSEGDLILCRMNNKEDFAIIEKALKNYEKLNKDYSRVVNEKIELTVMCAQEHEALRIIIEKDVEIGLLKSILHADKSLHTASYYNSHFIAPYRHLTQEEFDLLKEALKYE